MGRLKRIKPFKANAFGLQLDANEIQTLEKLFHKLNPQLLRGQAYIAGVGSPSTNLLFETQLEGFVYSISCSKILKRKEWSDRQLLIIQMIQAGRNNLDIAEWLGITLASVKVYLKRIFRKLGILSRQELKKFRIEGR